jgi:hypothetical protein
LIYLFYTYSTNGSYYEKIKPKIAATIIHKK